MKYPSKDVHFRGNESFVTNKQTNRRTGQKQYATNLSMQGHKNVGSPTVNKSASDGTIYAAAIKVVTLVSISVKC